MILIIKSIIGLCFEGYAFYAIITGRYRIFISSEIRGRPARIAGAIILLATPISGLLKLSLGIASEILIEPEIVFWFGLPLELIAWFVVLWSSASYARRHVEVNPEVTRESLSPEKIEPYLDEMEKLLEEREK